MNYAAIKKTDVANGPGVRVSLFVSGCTHGCKGCFNSEAWDFAYGSLYTRQTQEEILEALSPSYIRGFTALGGEPFEEENRLTVLELLKVIREKYPEKDIWCYTDFIEFTVFSMVFVRFLTAFPVVLNSLAVLISFSGVTLIIPSIICILLFVLLFRLF